MRALLILVLTAGVALAADWPQWMGPNRDGVWVEDGIVDTLPAGGPKKLWSIPLAGGYSGPAVANGRVFVMDYLRATGDDKPDAAKKSELTGKERIHCYTTGKGNKKWIYEYDCDYHVSYPAGPRCTPTVHEGKVYALGTMGRLTCIDAEKGTEIWKSDFTKEFSAKAPIWGFCGHPLIYKDTVICNVGGPEALIVAFDKDNGKVKWKAVSTPPDDGPGYCPPSLIEAGGVTQLILWYPQAIVSLNPATGEVYWKEPLKPLYGMSIMMPRKSGDLLYAGGIGGAGVAINLSRKAPTAAVEWRGTKSTGVYPANSTPVAVDGTLYGVDVSGHLRAVEVSTGKRLWETTSPTVEEADKPTPHGTAFLVRHNDRFFLFNEKGSLIVAKLTPEKYEEVSRAKLIDPTTIAFNRTVVWSHPAFAEKCIFARNDKEMACYWLGKNPAP